MTKLLQGGAKPLPKHAFKDSQFYIVPVLPPGKSRLPRTPLVWDVAEYCQSFWLVSGWGENPPPQYWRSYQKHYVRKATKAEAKSALEKKLKNFKAIKKIARPQAIPFFNQQIRQVKAQINSL